MNFILKSFSELCSNEQTEIYFNYLKQYVDIIVLDKNFKI
jgi:hypothetical protein